METEPPSISGAVDRVLAMAHAGLQPHVAVIGRHALPVVLALLQHGCACVRSLRPDAAAPDCETADLAWILDVESEREFDDALRAAHRRARLVVVEGAACRFCRELQQHAVQAGLEVVSFDHVSRRVMLAPRPVLAMAA
jgi:hypothetical protein